MSRAHPLLSRRSASRPERVRPVPSVGELSAAARAASRVLAGPEAPCPRRLGSRHPRAQSCQPGAFEAAAHSKSQRAVSRKTENQFALQRGGEATPNKEMPARYHSALGAHGAGLVRAGR